jgi:hypothetical protein
MRPRKDLPAVLGEEKLGVDDVEEFLTIARNLVRKLAILKVIAPARLERGLFGYPTKESYWNSE